MPSYFRAKGSVDTLNVGVTSFDEREGVCEKCYCIAVNSLDLIAD